MMSLILLLVVAVAAFNIVAALVMVVNEKRSDIAILRTLGITPRRRRRRVPDAGARDRRDRHVARRRARPAGRRSTWARSCRCSSALFGFHVMDPVACTTSRRSLPSCSCAQIVLDRGDRVRADRARDDLPGAARRGHRARRSAAVRMMRGGLPYELRIGRRYLRSTGNRFLSFISLISMAGRGDRRRRADRRALGDERLRARAAQPHPEPHLARDDHGVRRGAGRTGTACARARSGIQACVAAAPFVEGEALLIADKAGAIERGAACAAAARARGARSRPSASGCVPAQLERAASREPTASCSARSLRASSACRLGDAVVAGGRAGQRHAGRRPAAHAALQGRRHLRLRHVRDRPRRSRSCTLDDAARLLRLGDNVTGLRLEAARPVRRRRWPCAKSRMRSAAGSTSTTGPAHTRTSSVRSSSRSACCSSSCCWSWRSRPSTSSRRSSWR